MLHLVRSVDLRLVLDEQRRHVAVEDALTKAIVTGRVLHEDRHPVLQSSARIVWIGAGCGRGGAVGFEEAGMDQATRNKWPEWGVIARDGTAGLVHN